MVGPACPPVGLGLGIGMETGMGEVNHGCQREFWATAEEWARWHGLLAQPFLRVSPPLVVVAAGSHVFFLGGGGPRPSKPC